MVYIGKNIDKPPTVNHLMVIQKDITGMIFRWLRIVMWESTMPFLPPIVVGDGYIRRRYKYVI